jgi:hypothetical protein
MTNISNPAKAFSQDCGCGALAGDPCPHTPIRCPHEFWYGDLTQPPSLRTALPPSVAAEGMTRECWHCGIQQQAALEWRIIPTLR